MREILGGYKFELTKCSLKKKKILNTITFFYDNVEFPDCVYIALHDCIRFAKESVVSMIGDIENFYEFIPLARIDELVLNIPSKYEFESYFRQKYNIFDFKNIPIEIEKKFWLNYSWMFAEEVFGIKLEWE